MFKKILIANRGEIAVRIMATCAEMGIRSVAVYAEADRDSLHVRRADEAVHLGDGPASDNYLNPQAIIAAARESGAEAIHPGYGFLSENSTFARAVADAGLVFIGPAPEAIETMGGKVTARAVAVSSGVPLAPGSKGAVHSAEEIQAFGAAHGYPVLVKASAGGGGRGMRRINGADEASDSLNAAVREATAAFGNGEVYLERYLTHARHIEVQVFADTRGNTVYFGDRDCSIQRRHQKLVEEAPAPGLTDELRRRMGEAAVRLAQHVGYVGAGTVEFMVEDENFYFLEMNTRIQVEHPVTELVQDIDIVREQIRVAAGEPLSVTESGRPSKGVAIEARINAEDISGGRFMPSPGKIAGLTSPEAEGLRFDTGYESGDEVLPYYDSLIGKLIAWGPDRDKTIQVLIQGLDALRIDGVKTTAPAARLVAGHPDFQQLRYSTLWLESAVDFPESVDGAEDDSLARNEVEVGGRFYVIPFFQEGVAAVGATATAQTAEPAERRQRSGGGRKKSAQVSDGTVKAPMQGTIIKVDVAEGQEVAAGEKLFVLEAMKMENQVIAPVSGTAGPIMVAQGDSVASGTVLATLEMAGVTA